MNTTQPAQDYAEAAARITTLQAFDDATIYPKCRTRFLSHGQRTTWAIVFLHGYTNCPQQWERFAGPWHARGHNILIPRLPGHGTLDRFSDALATPGAAAMCAASDAALDVARGLGERVAIVGLSLSGALILRAARMRADLALAISIAPQIAPRNVPLALAPLLVALIRRIPNRFIWWDQKLKAAMPGPLHAYPRFPSRGMGEMFGIGLAELAAARRPGARPQAGHTLLVTNAYDPALNNAPAHEIIERWRAHGASNVELYDFDASEQLLHDLVEPDQIGQRIDFVYPVLNELMERAMNGGGGSPRGG
ncbi:MAG: alpha/beta fold hydrolase [Chloroflexi bacterium]|nr:alpha/beta fold hydrolase [Chloroflexota bacterium]